MYESDVDDFEESPEFQDLGDNARNALQAMVECYELSIPGCEPQNLFITSESDEAVAALLKCYQNTKINTVTCELLPSCKDRDIAFGLLTNSGVPSRKGWKNCSWVTLLYDLESAVKSKGIDQFVITGLHNFVARKMSGAVYHRAELIVDISNFIKLPCVLIGRRVAEKLLIENQRLATRCLRRQVI